MSWGYFPRLQAFGTPRAPFRAKKQTCLELSVTAARDRYPSAGQPWRPIYRD